MFTDTKFIRNIFVTVVREVFTSVKLLQTLVNLVTNMFTNHVTDSVNFIFVTYLQPQKNQFTDFVTDMILGL